MKHILWVSEHDPLPIQAAALRTLFGEDVFIDTNIDPWTDAASIAAMFRSGGYDDIVCVLPLHVLRYVLRHGITPLWSEMAMVDDPRQAHVSAPTGLYRFDRFRRLVHIDIQTKELRPQPSNQTTRILWLSSHSPMRVMKDELRRLFGNYEIVHNPSRLRDARQVHHLCREEGYDEILINGPLSLLGEVAKQGVFPLMHIMENRRFVHFVRVVGVELVFEEV